MMWKFMRSKEPRKYQQILNDNGLKNFYIYFSTVRSYELSILIKIRRHKLLKLVKKLGYSYSLFKNKKNLNNVLGAIDYDEKIIWINGSLKGSDFFVDFIFVVEIGHILLQHQNYTKTGLIFDRFLYVGGANNIFLPIITSVKGGRSTHEAYLFARECCFGR